MMADINSTLEQRGKTHGRYEDHAMYTQQIKQIIRQSVSYSKLSMDQVETLDMIAHKLGRILAGNPDFFDHWHDIAGYATLSAKLCSDAPAEKKEDKPVINNPEPTWRPRYRVEGRNKDSNGDYRYVVHDTVTGESSNEMNYASAHTFANSWNSRDQNGND